MLVPALLVAFAYWITWLIDGILGWQTMTRPIVLGTVIGLLCGDLKAGNQPCDPVSKRYKQCRN